MRPTLFVILSLLACALAQQTGLPLAGWSGTTLGAFTYTQPNVSVTSPYVAFNYTFASTGVREVVALGESDFSPVVYVYAGSFNPASPYPYFRKLSQENGQYDEGPSVDDFVTFTAGTNYFFVVTGDGDDEDGYFAVNVFDSVVFGNNAAGALWGGVSWDSDDYTCEDETYQVPYARFSWVQNTTGRYDIVAGFDLNTTYNDGSDDWDVIVALFLGNVSDSVITGATPCESGIINGAGSDDDRSATIIGAYLTQGNTYTLVISGDESDAISNYGIQVVPSRVVFVNLQGYDQPESEEPCTPDEFSTNTPWYAFSFTAQANQGPFIVNNADFEEQFNYTWFDTEIFFYQGSNTGSGSTPPATCPAGTSLLTTADTTAAVPVTAGTVYSIVVSSWDGEQYSNGPYAAYIWALTGTLVSNSAATLATTTTTTTTAAGTTGATGTGATGTGATGTGATGTSGATGTTGTGATGTTGTSTGTHGNTTVTSTTSGAVSVCVSFVVLALSFFALML